MDKTVEITCEAYILSIPNAYLGNKGCVGNVRFNKQLGAVCEKSSSNCVRLMGNRISY